MRAARASVADVAWHDIVTGYPTSRDAALTPGRWEMDVGGLTSLLSIHFQGKQPAVMHWPTLNTGPELVADPGVAVVWETAEIDVLIQEGSQG